MHLQDFPPSGAVRAIDQHLTVESSWPQQGWIEHFWAICGGEQDHAGARIEAIKLGEQLIECLLLLVVAAKRAGHSAAPQRVQFIYEDDAGRGAPGLLEQIADSRRADADEHLDEFRAGNGEKGHSRLTGDRTRQECLSGPGRSNQQHALWNPCAEAPERFWVAQERYHFLQLVFFL